MKDKILTFIIGLLVGILLATGGFYLYSKLNCDSSSDNTNTFQEGMQGRTPPQMSQDGVMQNGGTPPSMPDGSIPEKPDGEQGSSDRQTPPEMLNNNTNSNNSSDITNAQ